MPFVDGVYVMPSTDMLTSWKNEDDECTDPLCDEHFSSRRRKQLKLSAAKAAGVTRGDPPPEEKVASSSDPPSAEASSTPSESPASVDRDECLCRSARFQFRTPAETRDRAVFQLFNEEDTMLPWLPQLCPMPWEQMKSRRESHRVGFRSGASCFMDVVPTETGELVGTAGFRAVADGTAEWGIVVRRSWQRQGVCAEAFGANVDYARDVLACHTLAAATLEANAPMRGFLENGQRLEKVRVDTQYGHEWWVYEKSIL